MRTCSTATRPATRSSSASSPTTSGGCAASSPTRTAWSSPTASARRENLVCAVLQGPRGDTGRARGPVQPREPRDRPRAAGSSRCWCRSTIRGCGSRSWCTPTRSSHPRPPAPDRGRARPGAPHPAPAVAARPRRARDRGRLRRRVPLRPRRDRRAPGARARAGRLRGHDEQDARAGAAARLAGRPARPRGADPPREAPRRPGHRADRAARVRGLHRPRRARPPPAPHAGALPSAARRARRGAEAASCPRRRSRASPPGCTSRSSCRRPRRARDPPHGGTRGASSCERSSDYEATRPADADARLRRAARARDRARRARARPAIRQPQRAGGQGPSGLPISQWWPNGSATRPRRHPWSSSPAATSRAPASTARAIAASGSSATGASARSRRRRVSGLKLRVLGRLVGDPERRVLADRELGDDRLVADLVVHDSAEGGLVERDRLRPTADGQLGEDAGHMRINTTACAASAQGAAEAAVETRGVAGRLTAAAGDEELNMLCILEYIFLGRNFSGR